MAIDLLDLHKRIICTENGARIQGGPRLFTYELLADGDLAHQQEHVVTTVRLADIVGTLSRIRCEVGPFPKEAW